MSYIVEGEPLDVSKINALESRITSLETKLNNAFTKSTNGYNITVSEQGTVEIKGVGPTEVESDSIALTKQFDQSKPIIVIASLLDSPKIQGKVFISTSPVQSSAFKIKAKSDSKEGKVTVSWIAVQTKTINI